MGKVLLGRVVIFVLILLSGVGCPVLSENLYSSDDSRVAYLDTGTVIDEKMMSLAAGTAVTYLDVDTKIKAIHMADFLPEAFEPSDSNMISDESSPFPIYIFFDDTDDAGIMYVYTEGDRIAAGSSLGWAFNNMSALSDISGLADWDVSQVTELTCAFYGTSSLTDLSALANWDTRNVISFGGTFYYSGITDASVISQWNTSSAASMLYMFARAKSLIVADVSGWDTSHVVNMGSMFAVGDSYKGNGQLQEIRGLEKLDVSKVRDMTCMFYGAGNMTHYDIGGWDVSSVVSFNHMFCDNFRLESLDLSGWDVSNVRTMFDMFDDCYAMTSIGDVSGWNTASLIDIGGWLNGARSFAGENGVLDLSGWDTSKLMAMGEMFRGIRVREIDLSGWDFSAVTDVKWEGAGEGIYYESGNTSGYKGLAGMFLNASELDTILFSRSSFDSLWDALNRGVASEDMFKGIGVNAIKIGKTESGETEEEKY